MISFGDYLKDYLEFNNISQTQFALRMGVTQKHLNEIINNKKNVTAEMAANIERLTGISASFILKIENSKRIREEILNKYKSKENLKTEIYKEYSINELKKNSWINFKDETDIFQICIDLLDFLKIKNFDIINKLEEQVLFKKNGNDFKKLALWIAYCDELSAKQKVNEYNKYNFHFLVQDLKKEAYENSLNVERIKDIFNAYGIFFVVQKALKGTKVRGCFKVNGKHPAIYITENYAGKDSFYYELFHELGHCKSDYNEGKNKVIIDGSEKQESRADKFALEVMISEEAWNEIMSKELLEKNLLEISKKFEIPMSFIVGRLARMKFIKYDSAIYKRYYRI